MAIYERFSRRQKKINGMELIDVYTYDIIPIELRNQVTFIWKDVIPPIGSENIGLWVEIHEAFVRELGRRYLSSGYENTPGFEACDHFFQNCSDEEAIDFIDFTFYVISSLHSTPFSENRFFYSKATPKEAISELNYRFKAMSIGYEFVDGHLIRVASMYLHQETVKPAIHLLIEMEFQGALEEFLEAHEYHRNRKNREAIESVLKAVESTLKAICDNKGYEYDRERVTTSTLINIIFEKELVPKYMQEQVNALKNTLTSLPPLQNEIFLEGQDPNQVIVSDEYTSYAIHLVATNIVSLINLYKQSLNK